jgi:transposase
MSHNSVRTQTIRGGDPVRYIALDVHQRYCEGAELAGGKLRRFRFPNTHADWARVASELTPDTRVVLEATGNAYWVYDMISQCAGEVLLANPLRTRAIAEARIKTDKVDAEILVRLLAADFIPAVWVPDREQRQLRTLLGYRGKLVRLRTALKNSVHAVLSRNGYRPPVSDLFGKRGRRFLAELTLPKTEEIILESCLKLIDELDREVAALEGEVYQRAKRIPEVKLLLRVPGLDVISIITILAEIGDISRFRSPKKICSYAGLVPRVHSSGKTHYTGHITKAGRSTLRWILVQAAHRAVKVPGPLRDFYLRLKAKKGAKVAIVAVARKLLVLIWALLTRKEEYREPSRRYEAKVRKMERLARAYPVARTSETEAALVKLLAEDSPSPSTALPRACGFS